MEIEWHLVFLSFFYSIETDEEEVCGFMAPKMDDIVVSIIVPVYNSEKFLERCLQSLMKQSFLQFEVLLLDDGSTDNSLSICKEYAEADKRIRVFHTENQGVSATRNMGLKYAQGKYIRFVDADDYIPQESLEKLVKTIINADADLVIGRYMTNERWLYTGDVPEGQQSIEFMLNHLLDYLPSFFYGVLWNKLYKTTVIRENQIDFMRDINWSEDMLFNMEYLMQCNTIYYIEDEVYYYERRKGTLSHSCNQYTIEKGIDMEALRFHVTLRLIQRKCNTERMLTKAYDFFFNRVHRSLNSIVAEKISFHEKRTYFALILNHKAVREAVLNYTGSSEFLINRILVAMLRKEYGGTLFVFYLCKNFFKQLPVVKWITKKQQHLSPRLPL